MSIHSEMRGVAGSRNMKGVSSKFEDAFGELIRVKMLLFGSGYADQWSYELIR